LRYLILTVIAFAGLGASAAFATDPHPAHDPAPHPGVPHPPVEGAACNELHPCTPPPAGHSPPVTVTVTVPSTQTVTVDRPAPPPAIVTTPAPPAVTITTPPTTRTITKTVVKWRTRTVTKWRTKIVTRVICPDPPPKIKGCEGDCKKVFEGANG
jgi:hypothetical protein